MLETTVTGSYPKLLDDQRIRRTINRMDRGQATEEELEQAYREVTVSAIRDQEEAGLDIVTDGGLRWNDEITYLAGGLEGFRITGLLRFFDTNVLYRQPVAIGRVQWRSPVLVEDYRYALQSARKPLKPIMTGPFSLAWASRDEHYGDREKFLDDLARALNQELKALEQAGAKQIHLNEHAILSAPDAFASFSRAMTILTEGIQAEVVLYSSFGDAAPLIDQMRQVVEGLAAPAALGIDFTYSPGALDRLTSDGYAGRLLAGLFDARNTRMERAEDVFRTLDRLTAHIPPENIQVATSASLEYLPLDRCRRKLKHMTGVVSRYRQGQSDPTE